MAIIRLQRFMADCGVASRRECESMIAGGRVRVNGEVRSQMPVMVNPAKDVVTVDEEEIGAGERGGVDGLKEQDKVYFLLNKPKGILVTNYDPSERKTVAELMEGIKERVFPVGRLDMDSRGALIMTNDGELANRLTHPRYGVEKTYIVEVDGRIGHDDLEKIKRGMWLGPERPSGGRNNAVKTDRFRLKLVGRERGRTIMEITISEGKNREIRRVMARIGHTVRDLNRVAIGDKLSLKNLKVGGFRPLTPQEVKYLYHRSSPEFHGEKRAATQAWYEAKEMEKERKRIQSDAIEAAVAKLQPVPADSEKKFRPEPKHKGKKPFVPKSGRNAGKLLGGNSTGKHRLERELLKRSEAEARHIESPIDTPREEPVEIVAETPKKKAFTRPKRPPAKPRDLPGEKKPVEKKPARKNILEDGDGPVRMNVRIPRSAQKPHPLGGAAGSDE